MFGRSKSEEKAKITLPGRVFNHSIFGMWVLRMRAELGE